MLSYQSVAKVCCSLFPVVHSRKMFQAMALATRHDTAQISCTRESQGKSVGNHMVCPESWLQFPGGSGNDSVILRKQKTKCWKRPLVWTP